MKWKKIYERLFFLILLVSLFFGGWQLISHYFQQQIVEQQESYLTKKAQLLIRQLGFYNILCWWKIESDFLLTLFSSFQLKKRLTFGKI
ncbi:TPA: hypothetical protein ACGU2H_001880 [Enterococcus faecium]